MENYENFSNADFGISLEDLAFFKNVVAPT